MLLFLSVDFSIRSEIRYLPWLGVSTEEKRLVFLILHNFHFDLYIHIFLHKLYTHVFNKATKQS